MPNLFRSSANCLRTSKRRYRSTSSCVAAALRSFSSPSRAASRSPATASSGSIPAKPSSVATGRSSGTLPRTAQGPRARSKRWPQGRICSTCSRPNWRSTRWPRSPGSRASRAAWSAIWATTSSASSSRGCSSLPHPTLPDAIFLLADTAGRIRSRLRPPAAHRQRSGGWTSAAKTRQPPGAMPSAGSTNCRRPSRPRCPLTRQDPAPGLLHGPCVEYGRGPVLCRG